MWPGVTPEHSDVTPEYGNIGITRIIARISEI